MAGFQRTVCTKTNKPPNKWGLSDKLKKVVITYLKYSIIKNIKKGTLRVPTLVSPKKIPQAGEQENLNLGLSYYNNLIMIYY
jgi:hypothetical protein